MLTYEQDPEVIRWGLLLFDGDPFSNYSFGGTATQDDAVYYHDQYCKDNHYNMESNNVENDELYALEEELLQLAVAEELEYPHEGAENLQISDFSQDWTNQSMENFSTGQENGQEEAGMAPCNPCSSPDEKSYSGDEWSYSIESIDWYALDGEEVGKRLNLMVPIPHVPRINGDIPSVDEATVDHQRLLDRLLLYDLLELKVQGDGNCQFRALSDQFYRTPEHHKFVRQQIVNQLKSYPEIYEGYVPMAYFDYLEKMSRNGEWGDHVTLQAAADSYGIKIFVITSFKDTCYIEILPNVQRSNRVIFLSFWAEVHYNSIYPEGDATTFDTEEKEVNAVD